MAFTGDMAPSLHPTKYWGSYSVGWLIDSPKIPVRDNKILELVEKLQRYNGILFKMGLAILISAFLLLKIVKIWLKYIVRSP